MVPQPETQIAHHVPGRLRLRIPRLRQDAELAERLRRDLEQLDDVIEVSVRPVSGSVVLHYQASDGEADSFVTSLASLLPLEAPQPTPPPSAGAPWGDTAADWAHDHWAEMDRKLRDATGGALNLGTVFPLSFLLLGIRQLLLQPVLDPIPWFVAFYYSFESFRHYYGRPTRQP